MTTPKEAAAPAFSLIDQEGKTHSLADCAGKVVVLEWTNPECPYVQFHYAPEQRTMVKLAEKYQPQGVIWLAIDSTNFHDQAGIKKWHDTQKLPYPVLDDHDGVVGKAYKAKTTPHVFVIDKQGRIAYQGAIDDDSGRKGEAKINYVAQALDAVLAGKAPETAETPPYGCSVKYKP
ncbi:MAG: thioredoxin family protein [Sedimentisphaerales bacterium]|nr:thioredoxin family protein [Sedimentisphaerales bacterium]